MNWKVKAVLVKLENTALYFVAGLLWGRFLDWWHLFLLAFPVIAVAMAIELIHYKRFKVDLGGPEEAEQEAFLSALDTYFNTVLWFLMGFNIAKWVWGS
jgi:hypothetical protein